MVVYHTGTGDTDIALRNTEVTTTGVTTTDAQGDTHPDFGIYSWNFGGGNHAIRLTNTDVWTSGDRAYGILGQTYDSRRAIDNQGIDYDLLIDVTGGSITTTGPDAHGYTDTSRAMS